MDMITEILQHKICVSVPDVCKIDHYNKKSLKRIKQIIKSSISFDYKAWGTEGYK